MRRTMSINARIASNSSLISKLNIKKNTGITSIVLVITILFFYDEMIKYSNSKGFLLVAI